MSNKYTCHPNPWATENESKIFMNKMVGNPKAAAHVAIDLQYWSL